MNSSFFRLLIGSILLSCLLISCGDESTSTTGEENGDSLAVESASPQAQLLKRVLGKWELIETHVDLDKFPMGGTFLEFTDQGNVIISNPGDPDLEDESLTFLFEEKTITFGNVPQEILFMSSDSLVLQRNTDGISQKDIYSRVAD